MSDAFSRFDGGIPENYDKGLGPHIFVDYGADMARRAAEAAPQRVLEVAAGTGIVSRMLRDALGGDAHLTVSDLNPPMLEVARAKFADGENVSFEPADATDLPFDDAAFDLVACQFGVMFFPDKDKAYREVHRVLAPGGRYIFNVWGSLDDNPFARLAQETISAFFPKDPPTFYELPFGYHKIDPIKDSLSAAGFEDAEASVVKFDKEIPKAEVFAQGLVFGNPVFEEIRTRTNAEPKDVAAAVEAALIEAFGSDPGRMPLQAVVVSARKG